MPIDKEGNLIPDFGGGSNQEKSQVGEGGASRNASCQFARESWFGASYVFARESWVSWLGVV